MTVPDEPVEVIGQVPISEVALPVPVTPDRLMVTPLSDEPTPAPNGADAKVSAKLPVDDV
jgi:hypothetical protein